MKEKKIFDILEDAEYDSMNRLFEKCPEISDEQLDRIYTMSEKKFRKMKKGAERTKRDNNIKMTDNDTVEGVERSRRPVWLTTLSTAASIVLIAGIAVGSTVMIKGNKKITNTDSQTPPAITATTLTGTSSASTQTDNAVIKTSVTIVSGTSGTADTAVTQTVTEPASEEAADTEFIKPYVGRWRYQTSPTNHVHYDGTDTGTVDIFDDATYTYTDKNGNISNGTIKNHTETIGGSEIFGLEFSGDTFAGHIAYYTDTDELHFGNGDAARIVRGTNSRTYAEIAIEKMDIFTETDFLCATITDREDEVAFVENGIEYHRVTDLSKIGSMSELRERLNSSFTGEVKNFFTGELEARFKEKDGVLYEADGVRGSFGFDTSGGVYITDATDNSFTATTYNTGFIEAQGRLSAVFVKENGEWKISSYSYAN